MHQKWDASSSACVEKIVIYTFSANVVFDECHIRNDIYICEPSQNGQVRDWTIRLAHLSAPLCSRVRLVLAKRRQRSLWRSNAEWRRSNSTLPTHEIRRLSQPVTTVNHR